MYTPKDFQITDIGEAVAFMHRYSFATLISVNDSLPVATHFPFVVKEQEGKVILSSDKQRIITALSDSINDNEKIIAECMRKE